MPRRLDDDSLVLDNISEWRITAPSQVDDIGAWRNADPNDRLREYWSLEKYDHLAVPETTMPHGFFRQTTGLVQVIISRYPKLYPKPLQDVYAAVSAWHEDQNASRIPPQPVLFSTLEQAMMILVAIEADIGARGISEEGKPKPHEGAETDPPREAALAEDESHLAPAKPTDSPNPQGGAGPAEKKQAKQDTIPPHNKHSGEWVTQVHAARICVGNSSDSDQDTERAKRKVEALKKAR